MAPPHSGTLLQWAWPWCGETLKLHVGASSRREVANMMGRPSGNVCASTRMCVPKMTCSGHPAHQYAESGVWGRPARGVLGRAVWTVEISPPRPFTRTWCYCANLNARLALAVPTPVHSGSARGGLEGDGPPDSLGRRAYDSEAAACILMGDWNCAREDRRS